MRRLEALLTVVLLCAFAAPAFAGVATIDFATEGSGTGGLFSLLSGGNASGVNIPIANLTVSDPLYNGVVFNVTGSCGGTFLSDVGCLNFNTSTNTISIVGGIPGLDLGSMTLLSGSFTSWTATGDGMTNATGPDTKAAALLTAVGLSTDYKFNYFGFSLTTTGTSPDTVISTDIRNTGAVPEPVSVLLFGTGLLVAGTYMRRKRAGSR